MSTAVEVQAAVDRLAAQLARSILIEDVALMPLWWCTHGPLDPIRTASILHRAVVPNAATAMKRYKIDRATSPLRTAALPEVGMWARWCVPLRHAGRFLGMLWILDPDESLDEAELQPAIDCAELAASVLAMTRQSAESIRFIRDELLARLLEGPDEEAVRELARQHQMPHDALVQVEAPARPGGWNLPDAMSLHVAGRLPRVATSGAPLPLVELKEVVRRAAATRRAVLAGARLNPPSWDGLGPWRLIVEAPEDLTVEAVHPGAAILTASSRSELLATARLMVDHGGDVSAAGHDLHVHRTTIYYRLERIKEMTGVDMQDGSARTQLQLALWLAAYRAQP